MQSKSEADFAKEITKARNQLKSMNPTVVLSEDDTLRELSFDFDLPYSSLPVFSGKRWNTKSHNVK